MPKTLLILGAGLTGLPLAHYALKHYADKFDLKVVLVSRSDEFYWNIAAPRVAIPGQIPDDIVLHSISKAFAHYSANRFEFVVGTVETWDPDKAAVGVTLNNKQKRDISYGTVVVATGSDYSNGIPWKLTGTTGRTSAALNDLRNDITKASSIVVGGAGPTGVEFAGELGYEYAKAGRKKVAIIMSESLPFDSTIMDATRRAAKKELEKLNVQIVPSARVTKTTTNKAGKTTMEITKGDGTKETLEADLVVPTWGRKVNTSFAPASMLQKDGRLKVSKQLRAEGYDNVFVLGEAANIDAYAAVQREPQVHYVANTLGRYFAGQDVKEFVPSDVVSMAASVGRERGVGQAFGRSIWSFIIWYFKGRDMSTHIVPDYVAGKKLIGGSL